MRLDAQINDSTQRDFPPCSLHELIDRMCESAPDRLAIVSSNGTQTYVELQKQSSELASHLQSSGIGRGDFVGLCCDRLVETPALLLGILKSGAGYVPLDPEYPVDRLRYMAEDCGLKHVVAHKSQQDLTEQFDQPTTFVDDWDEIASSGPGLCPVVGDPVQDVAYVIYTSGSTGKPKGVTIPHSAAVNLLRSMKDRPGFTSDDRILATTTLSFDISVVEMFLPLISGGSVAVVPRQTARDASTLISAAERYAVSVLQATPAMWRMVLEAGFAGGPGMKLITGGEPLPRDLIRPLLDRCDELWNGYGPTETTVYATFARIESDEGRIPIGTPVANTQTYVIDDAGSLCEPGRPGELLIGGHGLATGYLGLPALSSEKFGDWRGERVYRTGDLARLTDDGQLEHLGRIDNQIKFHGHRIELEEIDAVLAKQTGVRQAATVLREDQPGHQRLVGYLLASPEPKPDVSRIRDVLKESLPDYMVPGVIVTVDEFPYTPSGKLDRKAFPPPSRERPDLPVAFIEPTTETEQRLAAIWSDVLQIERVGLRDNFLHLGGNSLRAAELVVQMRQTLSFEVTLAELFDHPTIESLLNRPGQASDLAVSPVTPRSRTSVDRKGYAIIGMAARMPGATDLSEFWDNLVHGRESIQSFPPDELDPSLHPDDTTSKSYVASRGVVDDADQFDAGFFGMPRRLAELTDPQQRVLLELAWSALEDAGVIPSQSDSRIGVWAGSYSTTYFTKNLLTHPDLLRETGEFNAGIHNEKDFLATRIAHAFNLNGPAVNVNTACSTSLVAVIEACKALQSGDCDVALAGGVSIHFPQRSGHLHQDGSIFAPEGHCRPFDAKAAGTLFSDGAGLVVLKRVSDAIEKGDRIYAVVKGYGVNNDGGNKASFSAPSVRGQADVVAMAQRMAGFHPESISYVEAHGTATPIGDPIEVTALRKVFEAETERKQYCAIGSVKSNIGHTVSAAGAAGLIKVAMAMHYEQIPATLHFESPNPQIDFDSSPFFVCDAPTEWRSGDAPRRAGVSSFGVGGTNAHLLLEEAPEIREAENVSECQSSKRGNRLPLSILPVSGKTPEALEENLQRLTSALQDRTHTIASVASTLQFGRDAFDHRAAVVADSLEDTIGVLESRKPPQFHRRKASMAPRDVVFMFPGQGAQYLRMGSNLYERSEVFRGSFDLCSDLLKPWLERDLRDVVFGTNADQVDDEEILGNTRYTQPALFALGYSLSQMWLAWDVRPAALLGHSIGEFVAACVAGVFPLEDGIRMIAERGRAIQELPGGSMMSVRLPGLEVEDWLQGETAVASYNGPSLCVVAGPVDQIQELRVRLEARDVVCRSLHTSHAFHSPMMDSVVDPFATFVSQFELQAPVTPIMSTVTGRWLSDAEAMNPHYWAKHLREPVRFSDAVRSLWDPELGDPSRILLELGPRKTLATLAKQHAVEPKTQLAMSTLSDHANEHAEWHGTLQAVAQLWTAGVSIDWSKLSTDGEPVSRATHLSLPTYAFQRERYFIEPATVPSRNPDSLDDPTPSEGHAERVREETEPERAPGSEPMSGNRLPAIVERIHAVFEDSSGVDLGEFDSDTTFFEIGLDSLVLTQTAKALDVEMGIKVTFRQLLEETTSVDLLSRWLDQRLPSERFRDQDHRNEGQTVVSEPTATVVASNQTASEAACAIALDNAQSTMASGPSSAVENIIQLQLQAQLQLMQQQLQALGQTSIVPERQINPTAEPTSETVAPSTVPSTIAKTRDEGTRSENDANTTPAAKRFKTVKLNESELDEKQAKALEDMIRMNNAMMARSKAFAQEHRRHLADPRTVAGFRPNMKEMTHPIVVARSKGVELWDIDGNEYIDFTCGFGSNLLGHTHPLTVDAIKDQVDKDYAIGPQTPLAGEVAKLFCEITDSERMAFSSTGSEAVLGCTRLARNYTGRDLIVTFSGDYHGILDEVVARGSNKRKSFPAATGIPKQHVQNTLILEYGTDESLQLIRERMDEIAGILVEPVQSRRPELQPRAFLQELGRMTANEPTALIFDEVITGLRIGLGGAQEHFGVKADLASYGKVVGGGMPVGVLAGKAQYMDGLDGGFWNYGDDSLPEAGMTYYAGTFVRHPLVLAASKAILQHLKAGGRPLYARLNRLGDYLADEMNRVFQELEAPLELAHFGSLFKVQFQQELVYSEVFFASLRRRGMHIWDQRPCLLTLAHEKEHVDELVAATFDAIVECQRHGFMPGKGFETVDPSAELQRPPQKGARLGTDENGRPGWFIPDALNPGQYVQVGLEA
ncbi:MAG: amino acid adenylation domain-containing protein [Planctomycetota bacterium]